MDGNHGTSCFGGKTLDVLEAVYVGVGVKSKESRSKATVRVRRYASAGGTTRTLSKATKTKSQLRRAGEPNGSLRANG